MQDDKKEKDKVGRILTIYSKLMNGYVVNKTEEVFHFGVNERSIQRDIDDIRNYLEQEAYVSASVSLM